MKPHTPYYKVVKGLFEKESYNNAITGDGIHGDAITGIAHITGGGIEGNLSRIIPDGLSAHIDLNRVIVPEIFKHIKSNGNILESEMLKTFNCGVGLIIVVDSSVEIAITEAVSKQCNCYTIGEITQGETPVTFINNLNW